MRLSSHILTLLPAAGGGTIGRAELAEKAHVAPLIVGRTIDRLVARGLASRAKWNGYRRTKAGDQVVASGVVIKPGSPMRPGVDAAPSVRLTLRASDERGRNALRDRAWSALRMLKKATIPELLELALRDEPPETARARVSSYLNALARRGVVARLKRRLKGVSPFSPGFAQWVLILDLGPRAPIVRANGSVIDRNKNETLAARAP